MKHNKFSVTLDLKMTAEEQWLASHSGLPASANDAIRQQPQATRLRRMLDEMDAEAGPVPQEVRDRVDALPWPD